MHSAPTEISLLLPTSTTHDRRCHHGSCEAACKFCAKAIAHAVMAGGSYLAYIGGSEAYATLFGASDVGQIITGVSSGLVMHRLLADAAQSMWSGNNMNDLEYVKKTLFPSLFLAGCNAFTTGLLTFRNAPNEWQQWCFSVCTGIACMPFGMVNSATMIRNVSDYRAVWERLSAKQKGILFLNFMIIFLIVCCALLGGSKPLIELFVSWFKDLFGASSKASFGAYVATGMMTPIFNCVELFFQLNNMLYFDSDQRVGQRALVGYLRNPYPDDAWQHKIRSIISTIFAIMCSLNFAVFTGQLLMDVNEPLAITLGILAFIGPVWSNILPADEAISKPIVMVLEYVIAKITGALGSSFNYCWGVFATTPRPLIQQS